LLLILAIVIGYAVFQAVAPPDLPRKANDNQTTPSENTSDPSEPSADSIASPDDHSPDEARDPASVPERAARSVETKAAPASSRAATSTTIVKDVVIRDQSGRVVFRGNIDLTATLQRIDRGQRLSFPNDGSVFRNRERRLPSRNEGYYREWVHPTPKLSGPGPQRVVTGAQGEAFYTHDHYRTFKKIR